MSSAKSQRLEALEHTARIEMERDAVVDQIADCDRTLQLLQEQLQLVARIKDSWVEQKRDEQRRLKLLQDEETAGRNIHWEEQTIELERILYQDFLPQLRKIKMKRRQL